MEYLLQQIWICLGLITLIAGLAGWFLRGGSKNKIKALEEEWKVKLARAQNERDYYASEVKNLSAMAQDREEVEQNYQSEKQALSIQLDDIGMDAEMTQEAFTDQEHVLKQQASELDESNRALLARNDQQQQFEQATSQLQRAEEKLSDLQTELDSTKIQLLDTTDKLSITEGLLVDSQNLAAEESKTILLVQDSTAHSGPSPSPIESKENSRQARSIPEMGSLLSMPTSSVEIVDARDKNGKTSTTSIERAVDDELTVKGKDQDHSIKATEQALDVAFADSDTGTQKSNKDDAYKSATLAGAGAAALGMAGRIKEKLSKKSQIKEDSPSDIEPELELANGASVIQDIHIIASEDSKALNQMDIMSTEDMIEKCSSQEGVERVAKNMGKESWVVRSWVSMADLMRIQGVDAVNAELLELSGIPSVQALASAKVKKLAESIRVIHKHVGKTNHVPDAEEIESWIKQAESLPERLENNLDKL